MQELADLSQHGGRNAVSGVAFILRRARRSQELGDLIRGVEVRPVHVVERPLRAGSCHNTITLDSRR